MADNEQEQEELLDYDEEEVVDENPSTEQPKAAETKEGGKKWVWTMLLQERKGGPEWTP